MLLKQLLQMTHIDINFEATAFVVGKERFKKHATRLRDTSNNCDDEVAVKPSDSSFFAPVQHSQSSQANPKPL